MPPHHYPLSLHDALPISQVEAPPVVNEGDDVCHEPTGGEAARGIAAPAPLVLEFVEAVFSIGSVTVVLGHNRSEEHTSELQSRENLVCRLLLEKKNNTHN